MKIKLHECRYECPSDKHLTKEQLVSKVIDSLSLWEVHGKETSLDLAIGHILNLKESKFKNRNVGSTGQ